MKVTQSGSDPNGVDLSQFFGFPIWKALRFGFYDPVMFPTGSLLSEFVYEPFSHVLQ